MTGPAPARRMLALLAAAAAAFTVWGSLVPFTFRERPLDDAIPAFRWAMQNRAMIQSRSDGLANVMLGVPLGFGLLGLARVDKAGWRGDVAAGAALLPVCVGLAAAVEFAQLFIPGRTCSGSDVLCQTAGAVIGMMGWAVAGRWLAAHAVEVWGGTGTPGRALAVYLVLLAFVQALPLDLSASPKDLYKEVRDHVRVVPFGEFADPRTDHWAAVAKLVKLTGLFLPAGLLAARLPGNFWEGRSITGLGIACVGLASGMEAVQLPITSRLPAATDTVVGAVAAFLGWVIGRGSRFGLYPWAAVAFGAVWLAALTVAYWQPFDFRGPPQSFDLIPGMPLESGHPLMTLEALVTKTVLFGLFGVLVTAVGPGGARPNRLVIAAAVGLTAAGVIEAGQLYLPEHSPSITDVLTGGFGAFAGAWVAARVRPQSGSDRYADPRVVY